MRWRRWSSEPCSGSRGTLTVKARLGLRQTTPHYSPTWLLMGCSRQPNQGRPDPNPLTINDLQIE